MSSTWFPEGLEVDVPNPGYGEIHLYAYPNPSLGQKPLVKEPWSLELRGEKIGEFLTRVTARALGGNADLPPIRTSLPKFITEPVARELLPSLQRAVILATAATDRYERVFPDDGEVPAPPLCARCNLGTIYTPGAMSSAWCEEHGHRPFGASSGRWEHAQEMYQLRRARWDREQERRRSDATIAAIGNTDSKENHGD